MFFEGSIPLYTNGVMTDVVSGVKSILKSKSKMPVLAD